MDKGPSFLSPGKWSVFRHNARHNPQASEIFSVVFCGKSRLRELGEVYCQVVLGLGSWLSG